MLDQTVGLGWCFGLLKSYFASMKLPHSSLDWSYSSIESDLTGCKCRTNLELVAGLIRDAVRSRGGTESASRGNSVTQNGISLDIFPQRFILASLELTGETFI